MASVAELTIHALRAAEVDTLFCVPGVQNDDFFDALVDAPDITAVTTRHEQGAAYMALGAAQVAGRPAAFCVVPGPGMLNAAAGLMSAYWGYARVLALVGQIPVRLQGLGTGTLHELGDQTAILRQLTKHAVALDAPATAADRLGRALDALVAGVPRPVSVEVPVDVWGRAAPGDLVVPDPAPRALDEEAVARAAARLRGARRPLFVVGSGAYDAADSVTALAERVQAAVTTRRMGHGVVPTGHPLFVPFTVAHRLWADADVVVGIGTRMEFPLAQWGVDADLSIVQVNVDPDEVDRLGVTEVAVEGDADRACRALLDELGPLERPSREAELDAERAWFAEATAHLEPQRSYAAAIRAALPDDAVLVEDVTQMGFAAHLLYDHLAPRTFLSSGAAGTLGAGTATAIGAATATDRPVVGLVGDGGFLFTATELATAVQHDIDCTILLFADGAYGNVRRIQRTRYGSDRTIASELHNPDFATLAGSFGVRHWHADSPSGLVPALAAAVEHDGPALVEVTVEEMPDPWPFLRMPLVRGAPATPT